MIADLEDPFLTFLLERAAAMLIECDKRPQAQELEETMLAGHQALLGRDQSYEAAKPNTTQFSNYAEEICQEISINPNELANFWFRAFWYRNYKRIFPLGTFPFNLVWLMFVIFLWAPGLWYLSLWLQNHGTKQPVNFIAAFLVSNPGTMSLAGWPLFKTVHSWVPEKLLLWMMKKEAVIYLSPFQVNSNQSIEQPETSDDQRYDPFNREPKQGPHADILAAS